MQMDKMMEPQRENQLDIKPKKLCIRRDHLRLGGKPKSWREITVCSEYLLRDGRPWMPIMGRVSVFALSAGGVAGGIAEDPHRRSKYRVDLYSLESP